VAPAAYSPRTGFFYTSVNHLCMDFGSTPRREWLRHRTIGANTPYHQDTTAKTLGGFIAWDAVNGKKVWRHRNPSSGGAVLW